MEPVFRMDTPEVKRVMYSDGTIVNASSQKVFDTLGRPTGAFAIASNNPRVTARDLADELRNQGFYADVVDDPEPGLKPGSLVAIKTDVILCGLIIIRRHKTKMGQMINRWKADPED